jgi:NAD(P)-dependent dehydrogenase (short-subunit alcohol dehydrogenase family)
MKIAGSTVLITGASSGIGAALAPMLASRGATVGIAARRADRLETVLARCREHAPGSRRWAVDLSDPEAGEQLIDDAWRAFGHLDCVVNNAAIGKRKLLWDHTAADIDAVMNTNFVTPVRMALAAIRHMLERGSGAIVNVASGGGRFGIAHESMYCASKFALSGWSEVAAIDLYDTPLEVKLIQPGAVATEIWEQQPGELPGLPGAQFATAEECASGICDALETPGVEFFVPADLGGVVTWKQSDLNGWIDMMGAVGRQSTS